MKRSEAMDEVLNQWRGQRSDGVSFDEGLIDDVETVLLGRPEKIEDLVADNLTQCLAGNAGAWSQWAKGLKANPTAGECNPLPRLHDVRLPRHRHGMAAAAQDL